MLVDPAARPVTPELPVAKLEAAAALEVPAAHGVVRLLGPPTPIIGLTPGLSISVEPRGIVPPLRVDAPFAAGLDSGDATPVEEIAPADVEAHGVVGVAVPGLDIAGVIAVDPPPPSKVELIPAVADPVPPGAAIPGKDEPVPTQFEPVAVAPIGAGLRPPGSSSVAPRGIPVGEPAEVEPGTPRGDVAPIAGMVVVLCAWATPQLTSIAAAVTNNRRIAISCAILSKRRALHSVEHPARRSEVLEECERLPWQIQSPDSRRGLWLAGRKLQRSPFALFGFPIELEADVSIGILGDSAVRHDDAAVDASEGGVGAVGRDARSLRIGRRNDISGADVGMVRLSERRRNENGGKSRRSDQLLHRSSPALFDIACRCRCSENKQARAMRD
jgi:hypothetical protein